MGIRTEPRAAIKKHLIAHFSRAGFDVARDTSRSTIYCMQLGSTWSDWRRLLGSLKAWFGTSYSLKSRSVGEQVQGSRNEPNYPDGPFTDRS